MGMGMGCLWGHVAVHGIGGMARPGSTPGRKVPSTVHGPQRWQSPAWQPVKWRCPRPDNIGARTACVPGNNGVAVADGATDFSKADDIRRAWIC